MTRRRPSHDVGYVVEMATDHDGAGFWVRCLHCGQHSMIVDADQASPEHLQAIWVAHHYDLGLPA